MKSTTFQQKILFYTKVFVCVLVLGILSWLSFMPSPIQKAEAMSSDVTLSVNVVQSGPSLNATAPSEVGQSVPIGGDANNIDDVEVYLDVNNDGVIDAGDILLTGDVVVGSDGKLTGSVNLPDGLSYGDYQLIVNGHVVGSGTPGDFIQDEIPIEYVKDGPEITCVRNEDKNCIPIIPGGDKQAFGDIKGGTEIVIEGDNFGDITDTTVTVGGKECTIVSVEPNKVTCIVPPAPDGKPGPQDVTICVKDGPRNLCNTMTDGFVYSKPILPEVPGTGVPGTGLFRVGNTVVTTKDAVTWFGLIVILAVAIVLIIIIKTPKKTTHFSASKGSSKKRNHRNQKVAFKSSKKNTRSKSKRS